MIRELWKESNKIGTKRWVYMLFSYKTLL